MEIETKLNDSRRGQNMECQSRRGDGLACRHIGEDWTESEWFQVWLQLAREGRKQSQN